MRSLLAVASFVALAGCVNAFPVLTSTTGDAPIVVRAQIDPGDGTAAVAWTGASVTSAPEDNTVDAEGFLHPTSGDAIGASLRVTLPTDCDFAGPMALTPALPTADQAPCSNTITVDYLEASTTSDAIAFPSGGNATAIAGTVMLDAQSSINTFTLSLSGHLDVTITDGAGQRRHVVAGFNSAGMPGAP